MELRRRPRTSKTLCTQTRLVLSLLSPIKGVMNRVECYRHCFLGVGNLEALITQSLSVTPLLVASTSRPEPKPSTPQPSVSQSHQALCFSQIPGPTGQQKPPSCASGLQEEATAAHFGSAARKSGRHPCGF